ncbi:hypothetical protein R2083_03990 [Nitrosomonas sp. Is35]|uniref:hypothetical protein n=1 Tax=Nitrosomonas sp. Is35 TaxID=3080534 RepID=UPI00294B7DA4|nr:hypothetical protein [Nitrosomonas sp. Is35]MDV6346677.1 hypothetical protein [Nitrosomonas sp. Is35]
MNGLLQNHQSATWQSRIKRWSVAMVWLIALPTATAADPPSHPLTAIEIAGVSLATLAEKIPDILQTQGYTQINSSLYTKSEAASNGRSMVYRVEIDDTVSARELSYSRSLTGGRNKSPSSRDAAIPDGEIAMVRQLYDAVCNVGEDLQSERKCAPPQPAIIMINNGMMLTIDANHSVLLKASDSSTSVVVRGSRIE